jgi:hypothetical protein
VPVKRSRPEGFVLFNAEDSSFRSRRSFSGYRARLYQEIQ